MKSIDPTLTYSFPRAEEVNRVVTLNRFWLALRVGYRVGMSAFRYTLRAPEGDLTMGVYMYDNRPTLDNAR